ncbi:hypothetical protein M2272_001351 [Mycobacterium frederiksbergense]|jgi:hypothetical protein|uniref:DUF5107 domain-containing protein n=1 Tax=Mycolicibacterium frederiksbergense TaxID=117567 RepID=A0ABT6KVI7_9MYCO|nr:hypothetical protein [Mycolicibacterium frederiksbergense]MDH6194722.1 hypothetical protein [Mycolicibacterium frederiksbergense]
MTTRVSTEWSFNGLQALVLTNGALRVVLLPELGGKIWQVTNLRDGRDLLWHNPRLTAAKVGFGSVYDDVFFGGWDELFPNDIPEELAGEPYPDHGELWAAPWTWRVEQDGPQTVQVSMSLSTAISACRITRTITLADGDPHFRVSWRITNDSGRDLPYLWKQHVAVPVHEPARLTMGAGPVEFEDFGHPRARTHDGRYQWPYLVDEAGARHDMRATLPAESQVSEFQYATELSDGYCAVTYADGSGIGLAFDPAVFPSCWTFASYGGWRAHEVLILEPCTGYPVGVTTGIEAGTHRTLAAGAALETELVMVTYTGMADVTGIDSDGTVQGTQLKAGTTS